MKILSYGEILFDIIEGEPHLGGAPLNFAAHISQCKLPAHICSRLGEDDLGRKAFYLLEDLSIHTDLIQWDSDHATGTVGVTLDKGQPEYSIYDNVAYDYIQLDQKNMNAITDHFDLLYFGTLAQRNNPSRKSLQQLIRDKNFNHIFYDVNLRKGCFSKEIIQNSLQMCSILKLNDDEVNVLGQLLYQKSLKIEDFAKAVIKEYAINLIIVTAGDKGSYIYQDNLPLFIPGLKVKVADTVGAGDAFSAAFVFQYLRTGDALLSAQTANHLGAYVASKRGAIPAYSEEIIKVLNI